MEINTAVINSVGWLFLIIVVYLIYLKIELIQQDFEKTVKKIL